MSQQASGDAAREPDGDAARAAASEGLPDAIETLLLGHPAVLDRDEVTRGAQVSLVGARRFWHALGFRLSEDDETRFAEADIAALRRVACLVRDGEVSEHLALAMTRALGRTADRLAVWQTQLVAEALTPGADQQASARAAAEAAAPDGASPDLEVARAAATWLLERVDELEPLLVYAWRRHLTSAIALMLADAGEASGPLASAPPRVVGFADLVAFTSLVSRMSEREVGELVQRFEMLASDVVTTHGGRVIKTLGDEILFAHTDVSAAAAIALDIVAATEEDDLLPQVRVGMAQGRVVSRLGDVFGTTVNTASRLTALAPPGTVYVDGALAQLLSTVSGFAMTELRRRHLRGIGMVTPSELWRAPGERRTAPRSGGVPARRL